MTNAYQKILEHYETFSNLQKKVADYTINNIDDAIYVPVSKFARAIGVSQATIVRFAQHLGYNGFNEFRDSLFTYYRDRLSPDNRMKHSIEALEQGAATYEQIANNEIVYLEKSTFTIEESILRQAVDSIYKSHTVYICAIGANEYLGYYLKFKLRRLKLNYQLVTDSGREMLENLIMIGQEDSAIVFNFSKPSIDFNRLMGLLSEKKVPSVLITDIKTPPVIRLATHVLYAERGPQGTFQSPVVPMAITNTLFLRIAEKMEGKAIEALRELGKLRDDYFYNKKFKH
jgi:DNA-binding MurR/RpiR family transcriptional regulator